MIHVANANSASPATPPITPPVTAPTGVSSDSESARGAEVWGIPVGELVLLVASSTPNGSVSIVDEIVPLDEVSPVAVSVVLSLGSFVAVNSSGSSPVPLSLPAHTTLDILEPDWFMTRLSQNALVVSE